MPQIVFVLALVVAIAAGCGGGGKSSQAAPASTSSPQSSSEGSASATAWAASFCGYTKTWKASLQQARVTLKTSKSNAAAVNMAKSANLLFQQQLSVLGPPAGASPQVTQQLRLYGARLKSTNQSLQGMLSEPSDSASESAAKVKNAKAMLQVMATQLQQAYNYLVNLDTDPELKQALKSNSTCRAVFGKG
jgi:hypothetical protein